MPTRRYNCVAGAIDPVVVRLEKSKHKIEYIMDAVMAIIADDQYL
jgi:hypothetical protein